MENSYKVPHIGADCEVFLRRISDNHPVPVVGLLGGTKAEPRPILEVLGPGYAVQEDNVMAEFNIPPCSKSKDFDAAIASVLDYLASYFEPHGLKIDITSNMQFEKDQLTTKQARTFGCEPDYNAWTLEENEINNLHPALRTLRTAAAHVHVELQRPDGTKPDLPELVAFVKMLDVYLAAPFVMLEPNGNIRREFYGGPGSFRLKPYGIEFRTLSNLWIARKEWRNWVFNTVQWVAENRMPEWETMTKELDNQVSAISRAIRYCDTRHASWVCRHWDVYIPYVSDSPKRPKKKDGLLDLAQSVSDQWATIPVAPAVFEFNPLIDDIDDAPSEEQQS